MIVLQDKTAKIVVEHLKCVSKQFGIFNNILPDNMPLQTMNF